MRKGDVYVSQRMLLQAVRVIVTLGDAIAEACPFRFGLFEVGKCEDCPGGGVDADVRTKVQCWLRHFEGRRDLQTCRECGCTHDLACGSDEGDACGWVEPDLCSACAPSPAEAIDAIGGGLL